MTSVLESKVDPRNEKLSLIFLVFRFYIAINQNESPFFAKGECVFCQELQILIEPGLANSD